jgi:hypothetical protein
MFHSKIELREIEIIVLCFSVIFGTTTGQLVVMDYHGNTIEVLNLSTQSIRQLVYSCDKFYPEAPDNSKYCIDFS